MISGIAVSCSPGGNVWDDTGIVHVTAQHADGGSWEFDLAVNRNYETKPAMQISGASVDASSFGGQQLGTFTAASFPVTIEGEGFLPEVGDEVVLAAHELTHVVQQGRQACKTCRLRRSRSPRTWCSRSAATTAASRRRRRGTVEISVAGETVSAEYTAELNWPAPQISGAQFDAASPALVISPTGEIQEGAVLELSGTLQGSYFPPDAIITGARVECPWAAMEVASAEQGSPERDVVPWDPGSARQPHRDGRD